MPSSTRRPSSDRTLRRPTRERPWSKMHRCFDQARIPSCCHRATRSAPPDHRLGKPRRALARAWSAPRQRSGARRRGSARPSTLPNESTTISGALVLMTGASAPTALRWRCISSRQASAESFKYIGTGVVRQGIEHHAHRARHRRRARDQDRGDRAGRGGSLCVSCCCSFRSGVPGSCSALRIRLLAFPPRGV
jgi:hypothetical protein